MNYEFKTIISEHVASRGFSKVLTYLFHEISINLIHIHIQVHKEPKLLFIFKKHRNGGVVVHP